MARLIFLLKKLTLVIHLLLLGIGLAQVKKQSINDHWKFQKGALDTTKLALNSPNALIVNLPHTWNDKDVLADGTRGYYRGEGWYFKKMDLVPNTEEKNYYLHFEGANQFTEVFINGEKAGQHTGGYLAFTIDITQFLKSDGNEILVKVDNSPNPDIPPLSADFTFFGGLYRDVFLLETSKVQFNLGDYGSNGIFVSTPEVSEKSATILIHGSLLNSLKSSEKITLVTKILNNKGMIVHSQSKRILLKPGVFEFKIEANLNEPNLWSPEMPYLYTSEFTIQKGEQVLDEMAIPLGIRSFYFDPDQGFFLNNKPLKLLGANRHQDYYGDGNAISDDVHRNDLRILKKMGANFLRLAHYPQDPAILEEADKLGILVWEEIPLVNEVTLNGEHNENSEIMLKEMIRQHYNHPSIILWGYMNEIYWAHRFLDEQVVEEHTKATVELAKHLEKITRVEDPYRYTAMALHNYPLYEISGLDQIPQVVGWNLYHGWYYDDFEDFGAFLDQQHKKYPERIHVISEYGAGSDIRLHSLNPERFDFTMEGQKRMLESYMKQIKERPYIAGATVWNLIDFNSERRVDTQPHWNQKGLMTSTRVPKDPFYWYQANLVKTPFIKIAETNWTVREIHVKGDETTSPVDIYTNQEQVELVLNGTSLGKMDVNNYKATFDVLFIEGDNLLEARSSGIKDNLNISFKGVPHSLKDKDHLDIAINAGSNHSFFDTKGSSTWLVDKAYEHASWGYIGGEPLYIAKKIGTKEDIQTINEFTPLYQTMREGVEEYVFDVQDGWYEIELLFVEPYPKSRRFVDGVESPYHEGGIRIFDVLINNIPFIERLDLLKYYGYNYPLRKKMEVKTTDGKGIRIKFNPIIGKPIVSGVKLRRKFSSQ